MKYLKLLKEITQFFLIIFLFFSFSNDLLSQTNETVIEIQKKDKVKTIKVGRKIRVWYEGEKYKGHLDSITPLSIFINEKEFEISKIEKIGIKFKGTQITGAILGTSGLLVSSLGGVIIYNGYQEENPLGKIILVVIGTVVEIIGIPVLTIGSSMFLIGKKYKKRKGWNFKAVQVY